MLPSVIIHAHITNSQTSATKPYHIAYYYCINNNELLIRIITITVCTYNNFEVKVLSEQLLGFKSFKWNNIDKPLITSKDI